MEAVAFFTLVIFFALLDQSAAGGPSAAITSSVARVSAGVVVGLATAIPVFVLDTFVTVPLPPPDAPALFFAIGIYLYCTSKKQSAEPMVFVAAVELLQITIPRRCFRGVIHSTALSEAPGTVNETSGIAVSAGNEL